MAESDPIDTIDPSENPLELQPFQNLGLGQLDIVRALGRQGANFQLHLHQNTVQHSTVIKGDIVKGDIVKGDVVKGDIVKGDVVQGSKTDVNNSEFGTFLAPTGDCFLQGHSQSQASAETSIQDALPRMDGEVPGAEGGRFEMEENIERTPETISSPRMQMPIKRDHGLQTIVPITFEEESQTDKIIYRENRSQTNEELRIHTEAQTDKPTLRDRELQTDIFVMDSGSQTLSVISQSNQTNEQSLLHSAIVAPIDDRSAWKMNKLYRNEKTKQKIGDFLPLLETTWNFIQFKIKLKSIEKQLVHEADDVYKLGEQFASEDNFIHAVNSFYTAANLHRISNKRNDSVIGIRKCVIEVREVVEKMTKRPGLNVIVMDHVIPLMHEMKDYVQYIPGLSRDIKVEEEAWCLRDIGLCYAYCDEHQQNANMNEYAIELMNKHFNDEAAKYVVYGMCLNNAGGAYSKLGEIEKSIEKYKMSLKAYEEVNEWPSDEDKTFLIANTETNLKRNEAKLRK